MFNDGFFRTEQVRNSCSSYFSSLSSPGPGVDYIMETGQWERKRERGRECNEHKQYERRLISAVDDCNKMVMSETLTSCFLIIVRDVRLSFEICLHHFSRFFIPQLTCNDVIHVIGTSVASPFVIFLDLFYVTDFCLVFWCWIEIMNFL